MTITSVRPNEEVVRYRVLTGLTGENEDANRRGGKIPVAVSQCIIHCGDQETIDRVISALRSSDEQLQARPDGEKHYDWQSTYVQPASTGGDILFGVAWYGEDFFASKMDAFSNDMHTHMFGALGIERGDVNVTHWRPVTCGAA